MSTAIAVIAVVVVLALVAWFVTTRKHPEAASGHHEPDRVGSPLMHGDVDDRPAGPGAEDEYVSGDGDIGPGPSAENLPWPGDNATRPAREPRH